ncbi:MAG: hypothetical protein KGJ31_02035, partial [Patescibacteria group bacterium]|nr:hypothetical protein [Patescibacteria group bacterium]
INIEYRKYLEGLKNNVVTDFRMPNPFGETKPVHEFHNFLGEIWFLKHRTNLFNESPLGAFIYDAVRNKATTEHDTKTLIDLVNTDLTRSVPYMGKYDNAKFSFV